MKIVIDTNVVISGIFFGGTPRKVIESAIEPEVTACASQEILDEYVRVVDEMIARKKGSLRDDALAFLASKLEMVDPKSHVEICRDPDDDKFIDCALDAGALYIVSGDQDLLVLEEYEDIEIITAAEFLRRRALERLEDESDLKAWEEAKVEFEADSVTLSAVEAAKKHA